MNIPDLSAGTHASTLRPELIGRTAEQAVFGQLLAGGRAGQGAALVLSGAPGSGKSALLDRTASQATDYRVIRTQGVESELDLPYAGLQLLCAPFDETVARVAAPQREALQAAVGLRPGPAQQRLLVGLGLHSLLSTLAGAGPVLCIVDDAQWLDRPTVQALTFVARRLTAHSVVLLIAQRQHEPPSHLVGLPELVLDPMSDADAHALFAAAMPGRVDHAILARVIAEARGNPQALLESVDGLSPAQFAGGLGYADGYPRHPAREGVRGQMSLLPADSRQLLVIAAADPTGDPALMWRAAATLGIPVEAVEPLEASGLICIGSRVLFARPLLRSLTYDAASTSERRHAHGALADAGEQASVGDRRTWHRARASTTPDEHAAAELARVASTARERAGAAASAAFLERAAFMTPDPGRRADRSLTAAVAKLAAGDAHAAARLAVIAETGAVNQHQQDRARLCIARLSATQRQSSDAAELLVTAARQLALAAPALARETHLESLAAALRTGRFGPTTAEEIAVAAHSAPPACQPPRAVDLLLDALARRITKGYREAVDLLKDALDALRRPPGGEEEWRRLSLASRVATDLWDDRSWFAITARQLRAARQADALAALPDVLIDRAMVKIGAGEFAAAEGLADEAEALAARMTLPRYSYASLVLAAWRGNDDALATCETAQQDAYQRADGTLYTMASYATAILHNGRRRYDAALASAQDAAQFDELGMGGWVLAELIEASARRGRRDVASSALERLSDQTRFVDTDWAAGTTARCRALLATDSTAEDLYVEAIDRLTHVKIKTELARAHLLYGEWLRRQGRRVDARKPLRLAHESFADIGAASFADRANLELLASGETARRRTEDTQALTPQETRAALLARDGLTNPEIGERLFVSPRTVEYHLRKVFAKLGISSRKDLHVALANDVDQPSARSA